MRFSPAATIALTVLLALATLGAVAAIPAVSAAPSASTSPETTAANETPPLEAADPGQVITISVSDDGSTTWTLESRFLLTDEDDEAAFRDWAESVADGDRDGGYAETIDLFEAHAATASDETDREMAIEDAGWNDPEITTPESSDEAPADDEEYPQIGSISYSFTWTEFSVVEDDRITFGEALSTADGTLLDSLDDSQQLVIESPDGYVAEEAPVPSTDGNLIWDGPTTFEEGELEIVFVRTASIGSAIPMWMLGAGAVSLIAVFIVGYLLAKRDMLELPVDRLPTGDTETAAGKATTPPQPPTQESRTDGNGETELEYVDETETEIDVELLSDEERVLRLLRQNNGRMKQATIVTETGWSNAKVSQLLSKMDDNDEITKLRIGRENLITLPDVDPTELP